MAIFEQLQERIKVQAITLQAVAKHADSAEELLRGVRDVLSQVEAALWPLEQKGGRP
jgi:hypothetical protein